ncbi:DUF3800 domain-containing protein [Micromonospora zamorensis]|uniref:DUF3800 domain-containing protein n=1 Tax=Micromonospora zamorensis TaxID=709883 RepID=UPI003D978253
MLVPRPMLHAFIDEAGNRSRGPKAGDHFVMSAVAIKDPDLPDASQFLTDLRSELGRNAGDTLHWKNFKHPERVHVANRLGQQPWATVSSVVVCKRRLSGTPLNDDQAYLYTFRYLLERLSWLARDSQHDLTYTLAHVIRFKLPTLRQYEAALRSSRDCQIAWKVLGGRGGSLDQPSRVEHLQLADTAASATWAAFEPDKFGNTESRYLRSFASRLYRRGGAPLTSYGLKFHPSDSSTKAAYPWVAAL